VKRALGIRDGSKREDFRRSAAVAFARPAMRQGQASISTNQKGPAEDTLDSEIEVSSSRALPRGEGGDADFAATFGIDSYAARLTKKVYPLWEDAFPMWARAEGRGGIAVIGVKLAANGAIRELFVVRASGFPEFDRKVTHALEQASPYGPLPRRVRDGLTLHIAFDAQNPAVGRVGPGAGRR
jgi:TonB family protein